MTKTIKYRPCAKCGANLRPHYLKDGVCNGCRNPHTVVTVTTPEGKRLVIVERS